MTTTLTRVDAPSHAMRVGLDGAMGTPAPLLVELARDGRRFADPAGAGRG